MTQTPPDLFDDSELDGPVAEAVRRIALDGFRALWTGQGPPIAALVPDATVLGAAVEHLQARGRIELSGDGRLVAVHGLVRRPTRHRIEHHGGVVNTWCALDAIGIPAALGIDASAVTSCPTCGTDLTVMIAAGEPAALPDAVLWFPESTYRHLVDDFCSGANLFCSLPHLEAWTDGQPGSGTGRTLSEVGELGRACWGDAARNLDGVSRTGGG
ncbi:MAG: alkylmercury lyase family protein [Actinobacteria bacterium]|nr:alkylmercury lyase family protein [Actinomycetota bacterium]